MTRNYDDIINLVYPFPKRRPAMSMIDRGAQFSPFAALTGYDTALEEAGRQTEYKIELTEDAKYNLDLKQQLLSDMITDAPEVTITYFLPDHIKAGGKYVTVSGHLKKIDLHRRLYILTDDSPIPIDDVLKLDSNLFQNLYL